MKKFFQFLDLFLLYLFYLIIDVCVPQILSKFIYYFKYHSKLTHILLRSTDRK